MVSLTLKIRQVVITGKDQVELQNLELDEKNLSENEVLVETEVSFISAGTELANYTAATPAVFEPGSWCAYPWKSGYANVGVVKAAGAKHAALIGKRICSTGPHASAFRYKTDLTHNLVTAIPDAIKSEHAAAARMAMVAMAGVDATRPRYFRTVVVIGLGMVGNLAAQLFRITGAKVIGVDPSATRRKLALACGIDHAISGTETEITEQVVKLTGGKMANVAVDAVGHSAISLQAVNLAGTNGEVVVLGSPRCAVQGNLTDVFEAAHYRWVTIRGALEWNIPTESPVAQDYTQRKKLDGILGWIADGRLKFQPLITQTMEPEEIKAAYEGLLRQKEEFVGVALRWK